jgi:hypothetical protein
MEKFKECLPALKIFLYETMIFYVGAFIAPYVGIFIIPIVYAFITGVTDQPPPPHLSLILVSGLIIICISNGVAAYLKKSSKNFNYKSVMRGSIVFFVLNTLFTFFMASGRWNWTNTILTVLIGGGVAWICAVTFARENVAAKGEVAPAAKN